MAPFWHDMAKSQSCGGAGNVGPRYFDGSCCTKSQYVVFTVQSDAGIVVILCCETSGIVIGLAVGVGAVGIAVGVAVVEAVVGAALGPVLGLVIGMLAPVSAALGVGVAALGAPVGASVGNAERRGRAVTASSAGCQRKKHQRNTITDEH
jgi:hypothetical protein